MRIDGPMRYAHRVMCEIGQKRALAEDEVARHECDNPLCCEPTHLTPGSILDNNDDRNKRGKAVGAKPGRRHLTRADAAQIKVRIGMGQSTETILDAFPHASSKQVRDIRKSRTWVGLGISKHTPACDRIVDEFARA